MAQTIKLACSSPDLVRPFYDGNIPGDLTLKKLKKTTIVRVEEQGEKQFTTGYPQLKQYTAHNEVYARDE